MYYNNTRRRLVSEPFSPLASQDSSAIGPSAVADGWGAVPLQQMIHQKKAQPKLPPSAADTLPSMEPLSLSSYYRQLGVLLPGAHFPSP